MADHALLGPCGIGKRLEEAGGEPSWSAFERVRQPYRPALLADD